MATGEPNSAEMAALLAQMQSSVQGQDRKESQPPNGLSRGAGPSWASAEAAAAAAAAAPTEPGSRSGHRGFSQQHQQQQHDFLSEREQQQQHQQQQQQQQRGMDAASAERPHRPQPKPPQRRRRQPVDASLGRVSSRMATLLDATDLINSEGGQLESGSALPTVVVVGDQSDGKSTLLEAISGVQLPKGQGVCTRCPIILSTRSANGSSATIQYRSKTEEIQNLGDIEARLRAAQNEIAGQDGKSISHEMITATVRAPGLPNLSMVDLPGINRESQEREDSTIRLIHMWIRRDETVIVVVVKATNDLASSKGYQMAQEADPSGKRTLLVMTNCDGSLINKEDFIIELLQSKGQGLFAVKCFRSRDDGATREQLLDQEVDFFLGHAVFRGHDNVGTRALIQALEDMLCDRIEPRRLEILAHAKKRKRELNSELEERKAGTESLLIAIDSSMYRIRQEIEERVTGTRRFEKNSLYFRCRMVWTDFGKKIIEEAERLKNRLPERIKEECEEQIGRELKKLAINFPVMERIIGKLVDDFKPAVESMFRDTQEIVTEALALVLNEHLRKSKLLGSIPDLFRKLEKSVAEARERYEEQALDRVTDILKMQKNVFLNNPAIDIILSDKLSQLPNSQEDSTADEMERGGGFSFTKMLYNVVSQLGSALGEGKEARAKGQGFGTLIAFAADKLGIPVLLAQACVKMIQSSSADGEFHEWDDMQRLQVITDYYIDVVRDRVVDAVPMAVVHFFNKRLAKEICLLVPRLTADDVDEFLSHPDREQENRQLEERLQQWSRLVDRLSSE